ncbi:hypothetical protein [Paenibacillus sp. SI8]|uniref:hypothetical protein n=1 Tax=unclassified Paenibacillus TaxID=185978 RepID=UPI0034660684
MYQSHQRGSAVSNSAEATPVSVQNDKQSKPSQPSLLEGFSLSKLPTPSQIMALQRSVGNQAVQRMLTKPTPTTPIIQRLQKEDIDLFKYNVPEDELAKVLELFTNWEQEFPDPDRIELREKMSRQWLNRFLNHNQQKFFENRDRLFEFIKYGVFEYMVDEEPELKPLNPFDRIVELVFPERRRFDENQFTKNAETIAQFDMHHQFELAKLGWSIMQVEDLNQLFSCLPLVKGNFDQYPPMYAHIVSSQAFMKLSPEVKNDCFSLMLGEEQEEKEIKLQQLAGLYPDLSLIFPPDGYFTDEGEGLKSKIISTNFKNKKFEALFDEIAEAKSESLIRNSLMQFGQFLLKAKPQPTEIPIILKALMSIIKLRSPSLRIVMYDSLSKLLPMEDLQHAEDSDDSDSMSSINTVNKKDHLKHISDSAEPFRLLKITLSDLYPDYLHDGNVEKFLEIKETRPALKDSNKRKKLLSALHTLQTSGLSKEDIAATLAQFFENAKGMGTLDILQAFANLEIYIKLGYTHSLTRINDLTKLKDELNKKLGQNLGVEDEQLTEKGMQHLLDKFRSVNHLLAYAANLKQMEDEPSKKKALEGFKQFVVALMEDSTNEAYQKFRYGENASPDDLESWEHLTKVLEIPEVRQEWKQGLMLEYGNENEPPEWTVEDTDAPSDMLLLGTDISTCQNIYTGSFNECLLSYLIDGKNRAIVIKKSDPEKANKDKQIIARALFKILLDDNENVILYLEKPYVSNQIDQNEAEYMLLEMAKMRAADISNYLDVKLLIPGNTYANTDGAKYPNNVHSLGGPAPLDYNDTELSSGPSSYTIDKSMVVELPFK